jgi:clan AA aspartic protease (TIGR02281 family)
MKRESLRLAAALALSAAPIAAACAAPCRLTLAASLPLTESEHGGEFLVMATVDGSPVKLVLDTGSEGILLSEAAARKAGREMATGSHIGGYNETGISFSNGVGGSSVAGVIQIDDLGLGRMHGSFRAHTTTQLFTDGHADGLLGMSVLGNFDIDLDLPARQLRLFSTKGDCHNPTIALDQPMYAAPMQSGYHSLVRLMVPVLLNGRPFNALLDTGAPGVLLFANTGAALGLAADAATRQIKISGVGGKQTATAAHLQTLAVGPISLHNVPVEIDTENNQEADLLLGRDFMRRVHLWISNSSHTLAMQYPPAPSPDLGGGN